METVNVLIVPETDDFKIHVSHENIVWVNKNLGKPKLGEWNAKYLAPFWLSEKKGINRIYHILSMNPSGEAYEFKLGNSFILNTPVTDISQRRIFSYKSLREFNFVEISDGLLFSISE